MLIFLSFIDPEPQTLKMHDFLIMKLTGQFRPGFCTYKGITRQNGILTEIDWDFHSLWFILSFKDSLDINWIPNSVQSVKLADQGIHGTLDTRCMPRDVRHYNAPGNHLRGTIDIPNVPLQLEELCVSDNAFCGTLYLEHFSKSLRDFWAHKNFIECVVVDNSSLPVGKKRYSFGKSNKNGNPIRYIERNGKKIEKVDAAVA